MRILVSEILSEKFSLRNIAQDCLEHGYMDDLGKDRKHHYFEICFCQFRLEYCFEFDNPLYTMLEYDKEIECSRNKFIEIVNNGYLGRRQEKLADFFNLVQNDHHTFSGRDIVVSVGNGVITAISSTSF